MDRNLRPWLTSVDGSLGAVPKKTATSSKIDTGRTSLATRTNEESEIRLHLMLQAEKAEKAELLKTVASLQATVEGLQKQLADALQARLSAEAEAKKERDAMLAEIRDLGQQLRRELSWQRGLQQQQQPQPGPSMMAAVSLRAPQESRGENNRQLEQPSFADVVRRKYRGMP